MSAFKAAWIICDRDECGAQCPADLGISTIEAVRAEAGLSGWVRRKGRDVCPDCASEGATS